MYSRDIQSHEILSYPKAPPNNENSIPRIKFNVPYFSSGIFACDKVKISGKAIISSDITSNFEVEIKGNVKVNGNIKYGYKFEGGGNYKVSGNIIKINEHYECMPFGFDFSLLSSIPSARKELLGQKNKIKIHNEKIKIKGGIYKFDELKIEKSEIEPDGQVIIFADEIKIESSKINGSPLDTFLIPTRKINIEKSEISAVIMSNYGEVKLNSVILRGGIFGNEIKIEGRSYVEHLAKLREGLLYFLGRNIYFLKRAKIYIDKLGMEVIPIYITISSDGDINEVYTKISSLGFLVNIDDIIPGKDIILLLPSSSLLFGLAPDELENYLLNNISDITFVSYFYFLGEKSTDYFPLIKMAHLDIDTNSIIQLCKIEKCYFLDDLFPNIDIVIYPPLPIKILNIFFNNGITFSQGYPSPSTKMGSIEFISILNSLQVLNIDDKKIMINPHPDFPILKLYTYEDNSCIKVFIDSEKLGILKSSPDKVTEYFPEVRDIGFVKEFIRKRDCLFIRTPEKAYLIDLKEILPTHSNHIPSDEYYVMNISDDIYINQGKINIISADSLYKNYQWNLTSISHTLVYLRGHKNIINAISYIPNITVIDTAFELDHPEINYIDLNYANLLSGGDITGEGDNSPSSLIFDDSPNFIEHAIGVASIIGAKENNGGMVGVFPGVKIIPYQVVKAVKKYGKIELIPYYNKREMIKVFCDAVGWKRCIPHGLEKCPSEYIKEDLSSPDELTKIYNFERPFDTIADIINISGGCDIENDQGCINLYQDPKFNKLFECIYREGRIRFSYPIDKTPPEMIARGGTLIISAVGNNDKCLSCKCWPAIATYVLSVGAVDPNGNRYDYSCYPFDTTQAKEHFMAPSGSQTNGYPLITAMINGGIGYGTARTHPGTSFAAPHVSGLAALLYAWNGYHYFARNIADYNIKAIQLGASGNGNIINKEYGYGIINVEKSFLSLFNRLEFGDKIAGKDQILISDINKYIYDLDNYKLEFCLQSNGDNAPMINYPIYISITNDPFNFDKYTFYFAYIDGDEQRLQNVRFNLNGNEGMIWDDENFRIEGVPRFREHLRYIFGPNFYALSPDFNPPPNLWTAGFISALSRLTLLITIDPSVNNVGDIIRRTLRISFAGGGEKQIYIEIKISNNCVDSIGTVRHCTWFITPICVGEINLSSNPTILIDIIRIGGRILSSNPACALFWFLFPFCLMFPTGGCSTFTTPDLLFVIIAICFLIIKNAITKIKYGKY